MSPSVTLRESGRWLSPPSTHSQNPNLYVPRSHRSRPRPPPLRTALSALSHLSLTTPCPAARVSLTPLTSLSRRSHSLRSEPLSCREIQRRFTRHIFRCISHLPSEPLYRRFLGYSHGYQAVQCHSTQWGVHCLLFLSRRSHPLEKTVCRAILRYTLWTTKQFATLRGRYYADSFTAICFISLLYRLRRSTAYFSVTVTDFGGSSLIVHTERVPSS